MGKKGKKEKKQGVKFPIPEWMTTYTDMITLLFCFFVMLFALSNPDLHAFQAIAQAFGGGRPSIVELSPEGESLIDMMRLDSMVLLDFPAMSGELGFLTEDELDVVDQVLEARRELLQMASDFQTYFAEHNLEERIEVEIGDDYILLTFGDGVLFDSGRAALRPDSLAVLSVIAGELYNLPYNMIRIVGHTDDVPINTPQFPSNWELSAARAISVLRYFTDVHGISQHRVEALGRGEFSPVVPNDSNENRARNRRVEVKIMSSFVM